MLRVISLISVIGLLLNIVFAQSNWSAGLNIQVGTNDSRVNESETYFASSEFDRNSIWRPAIGAGAWVHRRIGTHWGLLLSLQYQRMEYNLRESVIDNSLASSNLTASSYQSIRREQILQHAVVMPLEMRYYIGVPQQRIRPFVGGQLSLAYYIDGKIFTHEQWHNPTFSNGVAVVDTPIDLNTTHLKTSSWQGLWGAQVGIEIDPFTISIWHQRNFRQLNEAEVACRSIDCHLANTYAKYHRLLLHSQLRIAYRL